MAKRKLSAKQKAALAKGRAAMQKKRKAKKAVRKIVRKKAVRKTAKKKVYKKSPLEHEDKITSIFINKERKNMSRRRKAKKTTPAKRRKSREQRFYGFDVKGPMGLVKDGVIAALGGVAGSFVANRVPVAANLKPLIPVALGAVIGSTKIGRSPMIKAAAMGMIVAGALSLTRQYAPQIALLAGEDEADLYGIPTMGEDEIQALTDESEDNDLMGIPMGTESFVNTSDI